MLGIPNQTEEMMEESLNQVIKLDPEHISVYSLILEEGTKLEKMIKDRKLEMPEEELERKMYWKTKQTLEKAGYIHYEISNFAKLGFNSKHNTDCWNQKEYIGFGTAAHSYINKIRYSNIEEIEKYINNINLGKFEDNIITQEKQDTEEMRKRIYVTSV